MPVAHWESCFSWGCWFWWIAAPFSAQKWGKLRSFFPTSFLEPGLHDWWKTQLFESAWKGAQEREGLWESHWPDTGSMRLSSSLTGHVQSCLGVFPEHYKEVDILQTSRNNNSSFLQFRFSFYFSSLLEKAFRGALRRNHDNQAES